MNPKLCTHLCKHYGIIFKDARECVTLATSVSPQGDQNTIISVAVAIHQTSCKLHVPFPTSSEYIAQALANTSHIGKATVEAEGRIKQTEVYRRRLAQRNSEHYQQQQREIAQQELDAMFFPSKEDAIFVKSADSLNCRKETVSPLFEERQVPLWTWYFLHDAIRLHVAPFVSRAIDSAKREARQLQRGFEIDSAWHSLGSSQATIVLTNLLARANAMLNPHGIVAFMISESVPFYDSMAIHFPIGMEFRRLNHSQPQIEIPEAEVIIEHLGV